MTLESLGRVDGGQTTGIAGVTTRKSGWTLQRTSESKDGLHYTITDEERNPAFEVFMHDGILFLDPEGERVAYLRKNLGLRPVWTLFTFKPNYEGQRADNETWVGSLYRYGYIDSTIMRRLPEFRFYRYLHNGNRTWYLPQERKQDVWSASLIVNWKMKFDVRNVDTKEGIAMIGQDAHFTFDPDTE